jgi:hypothetical protein
MMVVADISSDVYDELSALALTQGTSVAEEIGKRLEKTKRPPPDRDQLTLMSVDEKFWKEFSAGVPTIGNP